MPNTVSIPQLITAQQAADLLGMTGVSRRQVRELLARLGLPGVRLIGPHFWYSRDAVVAAVAARLAPAPQPKEIQRGHRQHIHQHPDLKAIVGGAARRGG